MKQVILLALLSTVCLTGLSQQNNWSNNQMMQNNQGWNSSMNSNTGNNKNNSFTVPFVMRGNDVNCPNIDMPVCGTNGRTYQNACYMTNENVTKAYDGWCYANKSTPTQENKDNKSDKPDLTNFVNNMENGFGCDNKNMSMNGMNMQCDSASQCNNILNPVCGENGITYANYCRASFRRVKAVHYGECGAFTQVAKPSRTCNCDNQFTQICATNGITYENKCVANCFNATMNFVGICPQPCGCSTFFKPVCGENGRNYMNSCAMDCANVHMYSEGLCSNDDKCGKCYGTMSRVCGKDGKTYNNACYAECSGVKISYEGHCVEKKDYMMHDNHGNEMVGKSTCNCPKNYLPVCCTNGITHANECEMNCNGGRKARNGPCGNDDKESKCSKKSKETGYQPVCGTDTLTYYNRDMIKCSSGISVLYEGECKPINYDFCKCSNIYKPVCGVDGKTYLNDEVLKCINVEKYCDGTCELDGNGWIAGPNQPVSAPAMTMPQGNQYTGKFDNYTNSQWYNTVWGNTKSQWVCYKDNRMHDKPKTCEPQVDIKYMLVKKPVKKHEPKPVPAKPVQPIVVVFLPPCYNIKQFTLPYTKNTFKGFDNCIPEKEVVEETICDCYNGNTDGQKKYNINDIYDDVFTSKNVSMDADDVKNTVMSHEFDVNANGSQMTSMQQMIMNGNPKKMTQEQKKQVSEQPTMYYLYFYMLLSNNVISYDTMITYDCSVRDVMYYIIVEIWKLKLTVVDGDLPSSINDMFMSTSMSSIASSRSVFGGY